MIPPALDRADRPGLGERLAEAPVHAGWNAYPDWTPHLGDAGFEGAVREELRATASPGPTTARWARATLERLRDHLAPHLDPEDVAALRALLDGPDPAAGIAARAGRLLWTAHRPPVPDRTA